MHIPNRFRRASLLSLLFSSLLVLLPGSASNPASAQNAGASTPTEAVRQFYKALGEKRFRDALMATALRPAIESLSAAELEELRPDFERMAMDADKVQLTGEQISGDRASVFVKLQGDGPGDPPVEVQVRRVNGNWMLIFNEEVEKAARRDGNKYFLKQRIESNEQTAQSMLVNIAQKQLIYSVQHNNTYADLQTLVNERLLPAEVLTSQATGYNFRLMLSADKKSYTVGAEPAVYGRTGLQSFYMDPTGIKKADTGGKPYTPKK